MADEYTITGQRETSTFTPGGRFEDVMEVSVQSSHGVHFKVTIPITQYTGPNVEKAIQDRLTHIDDVANL